MLPQTYPKDLYKQLEFDKILDDLKSRCTGETAKARIDDLPIQTDTSSIAASLKQVSELLQITAQPNAIRLRDYEDASESYRWLSIDESVLEMEAVMILVNQMLMISEWFAFFSEERKSLYPAVFEVLEKTAALPELLRSVADIVDDEGNIRDHASPELKRIRKEIRSTTSSLDHSFNKALLAYRRHGFLADNLESYRNGRRVLAVLAEYKRRVKGIILDESTSGRTVFIEPEEAILLNNELFELRNEERREIRQILKTLTASFRTELATLKTNQEVIIAMDILQAKTDQAKALRAQAPELSDAPEMKLQTARHPLLLLKHQRDPGQVIPFDLFIGRKNNIIIISGPNAGGKTITLKAVGLLSLMTQAGLLIPADSTSVMGVFHQFFADIGDQQSIENDLSTYASHLQNMKVFTDKATERSLVLIDEFGTGTEPQIGGAIAESILFSLHRSKARAVITTHYGNLKLVASETAGIVNASMAFDKAALRPTFQLRPGIPGSSFAFEMARRSGLHPAIIKQARQKIGKKEGRLEYLLTSLQKDKNVLEEKLSALKKREKDLERLMQTYDQMSRDLEVKRKRMKLDAKTKRLQDDTRANQKLEKVIREIREKENLEAAKKLSSRLKKSKGELEQETTTLKEEIRSRIQPEAIQDKPMEVGDHVKVLSSGLTGTIERIDKHKVTLIVGNMKMDVAIQDLKHSRAPIDLNPSKSIQTHTQAPEEIYRKLDIRGMHRQEALQQVEKFIDQALIASLKQVEIIHGKGNGTLRKLVREKLKEYKEPIDAFHPEPQQGGDGVTLLDLNPG